MIKRNFHGRLEIRNFSSYVENYSTDLPRSLVKYSTLEKNISNLCAAMFTVMSMTSRSSATKTHFHCWKKK